MTWQATVNSISPQSDPRSDTVVIMSFTDGTRQYFKTYTIPVGSSAGDVKVHVSDELALLQSRDNNTVTLSSFVGLVLQLSSGVLVTVPASLVIPPP